ncbi:MAG: ComEA family DNA-binding protein [Bacilli bacterium]
MRIKIKKLKFKIGKHLLHIERYSRRCFIIKEMLKQYKNYLFMILVVSLIIFNIVVTNKKPEIIEKPVVINKKEEKPKTLKIDIKGLIKSPGVYELNNDQRVIDAITLSGGLIANADTSNINLSKKLKDEMVIIISSEEELKIKKEELKQKPTILSPAVKVTEEPIKSDSLTVSLNNASLEQLMTLNKIGPSKAKAIIDYRNDNQFEKIEDLKKVPGIGEATFEQLKNNITI